MNLISLLNPTIRPVAQLFDSVERYGDQIAKAEAELSQVNEKKATYDIDSIEAEAERISEMIVSLDRLKRTIVPAAPSTRDDFKSLDKKLRDIEKSIDDSRRGAATPTSIIEQRIATLRDLRQQREAQAKRLKSAWTMNRLTKEMIEFDKLSLRRLLPGVHSAKIEGLPYVDEQRWQQLRTKLIEQERENVRRWLAENEVVKVTCKLVNVSYDGVDDSVRHTVYCRAMRDKSTDEAAGVLISYGFELEATRQAFRDSGIRMQHSYSQTAYVRIDKKGRMINETAIERPGGVFRIDLNRFPEMRNKSE